MSVTSAVGGPAWEDVLVGAGVSTVFQPVVDLATRRVTAYEALSRWPGTTLTPDVVFAAARERGTTGELDRACRRSALAEARRAGIGADGLLLVNVEPGTVDLVREDRFASVPSGAGPVRTVVEFTERDLLRRPANLLLQVAAARRRGHGVALDDVGAHPDSLALLDLVLPDIVKLDLELVQRAPARDRTRTLAAVMAHSERTGALVLAEGIETEEHAARAVSLGAVLGQGWLFGRPAPLPAAARRRHHRLDLPDRATPATPGSPADLLGTGIRRAEKRMLTAFSRHVEAQADNLADPAVVVAALQSVDHLTPRTKAVYERLAATSPFVALLGVGVPAEPVPGVRGVDLEASDPLCAEWTVAALGAQTAVALIARDCGDDLPEPERRFDFLITYDRDLVTRAMRSLLDRII